jgi:hypothetical protein
MATSHERRPLGISLANSFAFASPFTPGMMTAQLQSASPKTAVPHLFDHTVLAVQPKPLAVSAPVKHVCAATTQCTPSLQQIAV